MYVLRFPGHPQDQKAFSDLRSWLERKQRAAIKRKERDWSSALKPGTIWEPYIAHFFPCKYNNPIARFTLLSSLKHEGKKRRQRRSFVWRWTLRIHKGEFIRNSRDFLLLWSSSLKTQQLGEWPKKSEYEAVGSCLARGLNGESVSQPNEALFSV